VVALLDKMGTRHLTIIKSEGEVKVAQYGQWDGYPDGVGRDIVNLLHEIEQNNAMDLLRERVNQCTRASEEDMDAINDAMKESGLALNYLYPEFSRDTSSDIVWLILGGKEVFRKFNWMSLSDQPDLHARYYYGNVVESDPANPNWRGTFGAVMPAKSADFIKEARETPYKPVKVHTGLSFGNDRIFCEWAWVIDLDENKLECYCGGRTSDGPKGIFEEFENPVRLQASFDLPIKEDYGEFIARCEGRDMTPEEEAEMIREISEQ